MGSTDVGFNYAGSASKGGAASDLSCTGCVSQSELNFSVPTAPAHRVVVATSGGDYTSISAALAAISPTAADPYVIDVMPGTYIENITMKDYVHLRGAGREVTTIQSTSTVYYVNVISLSNITNAAISGLTIKGGGSGINNSSSSPTITGNIITGNSDYGIYTWTSYDSGPQIIHNRITENGGTTREDIAVAGGSPNISFNIYDDIAGTYGVGMYNVNSSGGAAPAP